MDVVTPLTPLDLKLIAIGVVTVGCLISGLLPVVCGLGTRHSSSLLMSAALCFGGGVLLATSVVHILPDVEKDFVKRDLSNWSQLIFCLGFLLIYFLDVVVQFITQPMRSRPHSPLLVDPPVVPSYGTIHGDDRVSIASRSSSASSQVMLIQSNDRRSNCSNFSLLLAFSIHSLLEGLVIGVEKTSNGVLVLLLAVCSHKLIVAFCLGAELSADGRPYRSTLLPLSIFILGSDLGIALGAFIKPDPMGVVSVAIPVLQGLAGGTLLYVVVSEILPRERSRFASSGASFTQFTAVCLGFSVMAVLTMFTA
uniref:Zinc transporter ZIP1 n=1 Tax=Lygus hesperus TaxID=30085 RepID=A0A0A9X609_LYGHE